MTNSGDRSARLGNSPARTSTVFIVAKDPETHFGDVKPAFAGHGAVLLEIESPEFYEHLADLIAEEQPELAERILPFNSVELKPAAMIRARKELSRTEAIVANLGCSDFGTRDPGFRFIAETSMAVASHVDDLKQVLPEIIKGSERRLADLRRHAHIVRECWKLLGEVSACSSSWMIHVPHPLTQEIEAISLLLEKSLPELAECDLHEGGSNGIQAMIESITCVDPDGRDVMTEYIFGSIQTAEQFIARLTLRFGDGSDCLSDTDRNSLETTKKGIVKYTKQRERESKKSAKKKSASSEPLTDLLGKLGGSTKAAAGATAPKPQASAPATPPAAAKPVGQPVADSQGLVIDVDRMTVHCNGKSVPLDGLKHRRFKLLQLLLSRTGVAVSHEVLCARGNPWHGNLCGQVTDGAIKSIVRELKKDLKPLGTLPVIIKTQKVESQLRPLLKQK
jgi:hypothetical protein